MMKICLTCGREKDREKDFHWQIKGVSRCTQCKKCRATRRRARYVKGLAGVRKAPSKKTIKLQSEVALMRW